MMKRRSFITKGLPGITGALALSHFGCKGGTDKKEDEKKSTGWCTEPWEKQE